MLRSVTALPPEGDSFSSCRSSLIRAQPGPGVNIPGTVEVSVDLLTALQVHDHLCRRGQEARIGDHLAVRAGEEPGHADIYPASRPVTGSGTGSLSLITMTYQRRCSRLSWSALTVPGTGRCWQTLTVPTAWNLA